MRRRLVLALALALLLALAGCVDAAGRIRMSSVNDTELAERASVPATGGDFYHEVTERTVARHAIENGSTTVTVGDNRYDLDTAFPFEHEGRYYNLSRSVIDSQRGTGMMLEVDHNGTYPNGTRLAFSELAPVDRRQLGPALAFDPPRLRPDADVHVPVSYLPAERNASVLLDHDGERVTVVRDGREYGVRVRRADITTVETRRYEATPVANSTDEYATRLKEEYAFTLRRSELTEEEQKVLHQARDDSYYADDTSDEGFEAVVDRFLEHRAVERDEYSGHWVLRYDGQLYWVELDYGQFVTDTGRDESGESADSGAESTTPAVTPH